MNHYEETFQTYDKVAKDYMDKFMHLDIYNMSYDRFVEKIIKDDAKILELGCGPGNVAKYVLSIRPKFQWLGIDAAPRMVELAKYNNPNARFECMDGRKIASEKESYDGIIAGFYLPYLSLMECRDFLAHAKFLLRSKGIIYISFVEGESIDSGYKSGSNGRVYFNYHSLKDILSLMDQLGFEEIIQLHIEYPINDKKQEDHTILIGVMNDAL